LVLDIIWCGRVLRLASVSVADVHTFVITAVRAVGWACYECHGASRPANSGYFCIIRHQDMVVPQAVLEDGRRCSGQRGVVNSHDTGVGGLG